MRVDLGELGFDEGGALLIKRALRLAGPHGRILVSGSAPDLEKARLSCNPQIEAIEPAA